MIQEREVSEIYMRIVSLKDEGETDKQFCERVGFPTQRLSDLKYSPNPRHTTLQLIAEKLGKTVPWLYGADEHEPTGLESWQKWLIQQGEDPDIAAAMTWDEYRTIMESELYGRKADVPPDEILERVRQRAGKEPPPKQIQERGRSSPSKRRHHKLIEDIVVSCGWGHPARRLIYFKRKGETLDEFCALVGLSVSELQDWAAGPPILDTRRALAFRKALDLDQTSYDWLAYEDGEPGPGVQRRAVLRRRGKVGQSA